MDTSEQYIKMCDCPEIQRQWKLDKYDFAIRRDIRRILIPCSQIRNEAWYIWLPRQDQIQEMIIKEKFGTFDANWDICVEIPIQFVAKNPTLELSSMEQIWLSCYMLSVHQKVWSTKEEKWVKK